MYQRKTEETLEVILDYALFLGISSSDYTHAKDLLKDCEYAKSLHNVVTDVYENEIYVDERFLKLVEVSREQVKVPEGEYSYLEELLDDEITIPPVLMDRVKALIRILKT